MTTHKTLDSPTVRPMHIAVLCSRGWWPFAKSHVRLHVDGVLYTPAMAVPSRHWTLEFYAATPPTVAPVPPLVDSIRLSDVERIVGVTAAPEESDR